MTATHVVGSETESGAGESALLTVTVDDDATVFSGLANVHRYDEPSASDIAAYVRSVLGDDPQWAHVHLVADNATLQQIIQAFGDYEVELSCDVLDSDEPEQSAGSPPAETVTATHPATSEWEEIGRIPVRRPAVEPRRSERFGASGYALVGVVGLVVVVCAAAIWFVTGRGGERDTENGVPQSLKESTTAVAAPPADPSESESPSPSSTLRAPEKVTLEQNGLSVELPVGFHLEPDGDMWRATGPDPDFRLQLAVDPLYGVAPDAVMRQVKKDIEADLELRHVESDDVSVRYEHLLPDGSHAQWSTWTDRDVQISIGCHTREAPTTVQSATCAMANESARFTPPG